MSTPRRGITAHNPNGETVGVQPQPLTACRRSMRTGSQITTKAAEILGVIWCPECWPTPKEQAA